MDKWDLLQTLAHEKDEHLKENRIKWKQFKRQLEELEQAAEHFSQVDTLCMFYQTILLYKSSEFYCSSITYCLFESRCSSRSCSTIR